MATVSTALYLLSVLNSTTAWFQSWKQYSLREPINSRSQLWAFTSRTVSFSVSTLLADCLLVSKISGKVSSVTYPFQIWRCWTVWDRNWKMVLLPIVLTFVGTSEFLQFALVFYSKLFQVFAILSNITRFRTAVAIINLNQEAAEFASSKLFTVSSTIYLVLTLTTTLSLLIPTVYRILSITHQNRLAWKSSTNLPASSTSNFCATVSAAEILIESSMLYALSILALLVLLATGNPSYVYAQVLVTQFTVSSRSSYPLGQSLLTRKCTIQGLAPTLILTRIFLGLARPDESWSISNNQLHFASNSFGTSGTNAVDE